MQVRSPHMFDMEHFDFTAGAEVYASRGRGVSKRPVTYRRFRTGGEAIRYVMEQMAPEMRSGAVVEAGDARFDAGDIRALYASAEYPWPRVGAD